MTRSHRSSRHTTKRVATMMDAVRAPDERMCLLCNKPMGAEPHFMTEYPHGHHVECWKLQIAGEKFPYGELLEELRCKAGHMKTACRAVERFGKWLRAMETGWAGRLTDSLEFRNSRIPEYPEDTMGLKSVELVCLRNRTSIL